MSILYKKKNHKIIVRVHTNLEKLNLEKVS